MTIDELTQQLTDLQEKFTTLQNEKTIQDETIANLQKANTDLMNTNHKLFLSISGDVQTSENKDNDQEYIDHVGEDLWNVLSKSEKSKLKMILEGEDE